MSNQLRICFVCLGNVVRSPLAEHVFMQIATQASAEHKYKVDSAGTGPWHVGEPPDTRMRRVAARHGLNYNGRARQIQTGDFQRFDMIIAMDTENFADLQNLAHNPTQAAKIHMLRKFDPMGGPRHSVPDPYYGGRYEFETVYEIVMRSCQGLFDSLENRSSNHLNDP